MQRTFYSEARGLIATIETPKRVIEDGMSKVLGGRTVQFTPMGRDRFGMLTTSDPEVIAALEKMPDVFDEQEFNRRSVPAEKRAEFAERKIEQQNRLIADLQAKVAAQQGNKAQASAKQAI
jgi:hypothetical protein